jgi:chromodomain-helicase-DNA-binding protein 7
VRPYQIDGLNFLTNSWYSRRNAILADEMGLGKTVQVILFLAQLKLRGNAGPFLVVTPLGVLPHWERELADWTDFRHLSYFGSRDRRRLMAEHELFYPGTDIPRPEVVLTTYEFVIKDQAVLRRFHFRCIAIDEAHRLKNGQSKLFATLMSLQTEFKVLVTGTPLQNNIAELWSLLHYLDPTTFELFAGFETALGPLNEPEQITHLQDLLRPLMLRRLKSDVEKAISPLQEIIVECAMTTHQRSYYQSIYRKNMEYLTRGEHKTSVVNLNNIFMELRKVCNHPYLVNGAEPQILVERRAMLGGPAPEGFDEESLIRSSGKMILLDKLLAKLRADGHRVLIFSQMTRMLDILDDYLQYRGLPFQRVDGSVRGAARQAAIDKFNAPGSEDFVFLLCTKAGGVGLNLASADTVVIYDSDWNPQNDIQATARCHRIGQTKEVKVYRFLMAGSYERAMFDRASMKLGLDNAVLEGGRPKESEEIEKLIRLGAYYAFSEERAESDERFGEEDIESILSRSRTIRHGHIASGEGSTFSRLQFEISEREDAELGAPDFWHRYAQRGLFAAPGGRDAEGRPRGGDDDHAKLGHARAWARPLLDGMLRFGINRWEAVLGHARLEWDVSEARNIGLVFLRWMQQAAPSTPPAVQHAYDEEMCLTNARRQSDLIRWFPGTIRQMVVAFAQQRLTKIETAVIINSLETGEWELPALAGRKPAVGWTQEDDRAMVRAAWRNGGTDTGGMPFRRPPPHPRKAELAARLRLVVQAVKTGEPPWEGAQEGRKWSAKEQRVVMDGMMRTGRHFELLHQACDLTGRLPSAISRFAERILEGARAVARGESPNLSGIPKQITCALITTPVTVSRDPVLRV